MGRRRHNTQTPRDRQKLVEDFERRLRYDEEQGDFRHWLKRPGSMAWLVHPTSDESDLLTELGIRPEDCRSADAYWRYRDSVYFVQLHGFPAMSPLGPYHRPPGCYYCFDKESRQDVFDLFLPRPVVTTADFHRAFELLEAFIDSGRIDAERAVLEDKDSRRVARRERLAEVE
jgi:hypothetical protein